MAGTKIDPYQIEPGSESQILVVNPSGEAEWQAGGAASGDILAWTGSAFVAQPPQEQTRAFAYFMGA